MKKYEKLLKALANARRLTIIEYLKKEGEASVGDIAEHLKLSFKATSKHLGVLFANDILEKEQRSFSIFYSVKPNQPRIIRNVIDLL